MNRNFPAQVGYRDGEAEYYLSQASDTINSLRSDLEKAERALHRAGYRDLGGSEWKPPIGDAPDFIYNEIAAQLAEVNAKHGPITSYHEFLGLLIEEVHEVIAAIHANDPEQIRVEANDVAVVCWRGVELCDREASK